MLEKVWVNGKPTYEIIGQQLVFNGVTEIESLLRLQIMKDEEPFYNLIGHKVQQHFKFGLTEEESTSRRHVIWLDECISSFQFLLDRKIPTMIVTMRSSSFCKLKSDLCFFAKWALVKNCTRLIVNIGSLHLIIGEED